MKENIDKMRFKFLCSSLVFNIIINSVCGWQVLTKMIPMRDGVKLHTKIVIPTFSFRGHSTILTRSPYGYDDLEKYGKFYSLFNFVSIGQDWRGTGLSEGVFSNFLTEDNDGFDTIDWITKQSWFNGKIYTLGASADGLSSFLLLNGIEKNNEKYLKNISGQFFLLTTNIFYPTFYNGGAYHYGLIDKWINDTLRDNDKDTSRLFLQKQEKNITFWNSMENRDIYKKITWPTIFYAGWYDIFTLGNILTFDKIESSTFIIIDPCGHCQDASKYFNANLIYGRTALSIFVSLYQFNIISRLRRNIKKVTFYVMKPPFCDPWIYGNYFTTLNSWPTFIEKSFYLQNNYMLSEDNNEIGIYSFISNPNNPVPTLGGSNYELSPCGPVDQTPLNNRNNTEMLIFRSNKLSEDLVITGPLIAECHVSSNVSDFDLSVRLSVYNPKNNIASLINDGMIRMRNRDPNDDSLQLVEDGKIYSVNVSLWNTSFVLPQGFQIQLAICGSNYPKFSINTQTGNNLMDELYNNITSKVGKVNVHNSTRVILPYIENYRKNLPYFDMCKFI